MNRFDPDKLLTNNPFQWRFMQLCMLIGNFDKLHISEQLFDKTIFTSNTKEGIVYSSGRQQHTGLMA
jgi:hypothetical protein